MGCRVNEWVQKESSAPRGLEGILLGTCRV